MYLDQVGLQFCEKSFSNKDKDIEDARRQSADRKIEIHESVMNESLLKVRRLSIGPSQVSSFYP